MQSLQKEQNNTNLLYYYDPQSAGINVQSPRSESTPRRLTLVVSLFYLALHIHLYLCHQRHCESFGSLLVSAVTKLPNI